MGDEIHLKQMRHVVSKKFKRKRINLQELIFKFFRFSKTTKLKNFANKFFGKNAFNRRRTNDQDFSLVAFGSRPLSLSSSGHVRHRPCSLLGESYSSGALRVRLCSRSWAFAPSLGTLVPFPPLSCGGHRVLSLLM